jgi:hypothetical protein
MNELWDVSGSYLNVKLPADAKSFANLIKIFIDCLDEFFF